MPKQIGLVTNTFEDGTAEIATERLNACGGCEKSHGCRSCLAGANKVVSVVNNDAGALVGDIVVVYQTSTALWTGAFLMYVLPVIGLIAGAVIGSSLAARIGIDESLTALALGVLGLALFFTATLVIARVSRFRLWLEPRIVDIAGGSGSNNGLALYKIRSAPLH